jgi:hypothetical protein
VTEFTSRKNTDEELNLEIEEIGADLIKNHDYYVDLDEGKIKKRGTTMHKSNGGESAETEVKSNKNLGNG